VIERLLETWLNKANERSFQIPFAHSLALQGHTILHVSRHCGMEIGKDVLTIAPDGVPCAYQLKGIPGGGRLTQSQWRDDLGKQVHPLVHAKIVHPSLNTNQHHRSYIVVNGTFDEEVLREIDDFNKANVAAGQPERTVTTIVKGQLFDAFKDLQSDFWATNLHDIKTYLELYLEDGRGQLPKEKLAQLFEDALPFETENNKPPKAAEVARALAGCAVICSAAISSFSNESNHLAEFEAWTLYWCYTCALAERWQVKRSVVQFALDIASDAMYAALGRLCDEISTREHFSEGDPLIDRMVYEIRMTHLLGAMGLFGLWTIDRMKHGQDVDPKHLDAAQTFCERHRNKLKLWGEYAAPQILAWSFFRRIHDASDATDHLYGSLVELLAEQNAPQSTNAIANAYYDAETLMPHHFGLSTKPLEDAFDGKSHYLEAILHLFTRANLKQRAKLIFPPVTRIAFREYKPEQPWQFFVYRNGDGGVNVERFLVPPHSWNDLRMKAAECAGGELPDVLRAYPLGYLAMMLVMPHRGTSNGIRWLATQMDELAADKSWLS
jgi:hypothetical protein